MRACRSMSRSLLVHPMEENMTTISQPTKTPGAPVIGFVSNFAVLGGQQNRAGGVLACDCEGPCQYCDGHGGPCQHCDGQGGPCQKSITNLVTTSRGKRIVLTRKAGTQSRAHEKEAKLTHVLH